MSLHTLALGIFVFNQSSWMRRFEVSYLKTEGAEGQAGKESIPRKESNRGRAAEGRARPNMLPFNIQLGSG